MSADPVADRIYAMATALWQLDQLARLRDEIDLWDRTEQAIQLANSGREAHRADAS